MRRNLRLYNRLMLQHLKAILAYQADFAIMVVAAILTQVLGFVFLWVVYERIPDIQGWDFWEVACIYALIFFTEGVASFFFEGVWRISSLVNRGELDLYLVRPVSPLLQVLSGSVGMNGLGNMLTGGLIITQALRHVTFEWSIQKALMALVLFLSAIIIRTSINLASCSIVFWTHSPGNAFPFMIHSLCDFAKFPLTIYSLGVQVFVAVIVPYAFISFFPAAYLFDKPTWGPLGLLSPLVALYCAGVSIWIFRRGLLRYESVGN